MSIKIIFSTMKNISISMNFLKNYDLIWTTYLLSDHIKSDNINYTSYIYKIFRIALKD